MGEVKSKTTDLQAEVRRLEAEVLTLRHWLEGLRRSRRVLLEVIASREQLHRLELQQMAARLRRRRAQRAGRVRMAAVGEARSPHDGEI